MSTVNKLMGGDRNLAKRLKTTYENQGSKPAQKNTLDTAFEKYLKDLYRKEERNKFKIQDNSWIDYGKDKNRYPDIDWGKGWGKRTYPDYTDWDKKEYDDWTYKKDYKEELRKIYEELRKRKVTVYEIADAIIEKFRSGVREYSPVINCIDGQHSFLFEISCDLDDFLPLGSHHHKEEVVKQIKRAWNRNADLEFFSDFPANSFEQWILMTHCNHKVIVDTFSENPLKNIIKATVIGEPEVTMFNEPFPPYKQAYNEAYEYYQQELVLEKLKENIPEGD